MYVCVHSSQLQCIKLNTISIVVLDDSLTVVLGALTKSDKQLSSSLQSVDVSTMPRSNTQNREKIVEGHSWQSTGSQFLIF